MIAGSAIAEQPIAEGSTAIYLDDPARGSVVVASDFDGEVRKFGAALFGVDVESLNSDMYRGATGIGLAQTVFVGNNSDFTRRALGAAIFDVTATMTGDMKVVPPSSAVFNVEVKGTAEAETKTPILSSAWFLIETRSIGYEIDRNTVAPLMRAEVRTNAEGLANIQATFGGKADIDLFSAGTFDKAERVYWQAKAVAAELFASGAIETRHYVYAPATRAQMSMTFIDIGFGKPPIPVEFVSAPADRSMVSVPDKRTMLSGGRNRSIG